MKPFEPSRFLNKKFGRLLVTGFEAPNKKTPYSTVTAMCDCGNRGTFIATHLYTGHTKSCGCVQKEVAGNQFKTHGMRDHPVYAVWQGMRARCNQKGDSRYKRYGGRGIKVCKSWDSFLPFYRWAMKNGYKKGLHLDRRNNDGNYSYKNCRFVTPRENVLNGKVTRYITYNGEIKSLGDWAKTVGITRGSLHLRIDKYKWPIKKALTVQNLRKSKIK